MSPDAIEFSNPFRPGAGHMPPYLAGRQAETTEFEKLLSQDPILQNVILTGLRGVGKTVLMDTFKPLALRKGWLWVGTDLSESTSISEETLVIRLLADLAVVTSSLKLNAGKAKEFGFGAARESKSISLDFETLSAIYRQTPGLTADKLKRVIELVWNVLLE